MKMFRPALAGALSAFVLLVCIQLNARVKVAVPSQSRQLYFEDRVVYQRAIEEVYWRHRLWPRGSGERPDRKPSLEEVMSQATIEQKVQDYLRHSELLEQSWQKPITPEQLQAEMDRMAHLQQTARGVARALCRAWQRSLCHRRVSGQARAVRAFAVR